MPRDPQTIEEWREAVDAAEFYLCLDSARQYGLVTTDISPNLERCDELLRRGRAKGIRPAAFSELCDRFLTKAT